MKFQFLFAQTQIMRYINVSWYFQDLYDLHTLHDSVCHSERLIEVIDINGKKSFSAIERKDV